jgi:DNA-binding GntR family transcriptional regulator
MYCDHKMTSEKSLQTEYGMHSRFGCAEHVTVQERVYRELRQALVRGQLAPGRPVTLRGLAGMLDVSPMPVRDAVRRLVAERALVKLSNRRVAVPVMTPESFDEICRARLALEPQAAMRALPGIDRGRLERLIELDRQCTDAMSSGRVADYMQTNQEFHFTLYASVPQRVFMAMIESLWLQFGPFMYTVVGRWGTAELIDQHQKAVDAIRARDRDALGSAVAADIMDGMRIIGEQALTRDPERITTS